ncbi:unnamed protein product [Adineta ricciae]|uniref:G-protein coupled receptors family 1 profile domain-containing protein n=1 Tax=Adineta ricciae TaxID=249248 RepID=A0A814IXF0_ADIRI|nr:unnamed protein product [Adineta ricciae]
MNIASIQTLTNNISYYAPYGILVLGNVSCICNFITFTVKQLRHNSCGWYFLMSALFDFLYINFGLFTKLSSEQYGSTLQNTNLAWCRIRVFLTWVLPCFATSYLVLASLDRCLSTSTITRLRSFSQVKIARRITPIPILLYSLTTCHQFFYYDLRPTCSPLPGAYAFFLSMYSIIWTSLIPQGCMLSFGILTYLNIRQSRQRLIHPVAERTNEQKRSRTDTQMIRITLIQVICSSILLNIRTAYYSYTVLSTSIAKSNERRAMESLFLQISSFVFYLNFSKGFFVNTLSSKLFRRVFKQQLIKLCHRITCGKVHMAPKDERQANPTKAVS